MSNQKEAKRLRDEKLIKDENAIKPVRMKFGVDMYYNDLSTPLYQAGKVYEIEGRMIARWMKRGGEIVDEPVSEQPKVQEQKPALDSEVKESVEGAGEKPEDESKPTPQAPMTSGRGRR